MVDTLTTVGRGLSLVVLVGIIWTAVACGGRSADIAVPTPVPDPAALLAETAANLRDVQSVGFRVTHEAGSMYLPEFRAKITEITGTWDAEVGAAMTIDAYVVSGPETDPQSGSYVQVLAVVTPQGYFSTEPISGLWLKQPAQSAPLTVSSLQHIVADLVEAVENPVLVGEETVDDVPTYRISGVVPTSSMDWLPIAASEGQALQIDLWTDADQKLLRMIGLVGAVGEFDSPDTHRTIRLTDIGTPVDIAPPEQFIDLSGG